MLEEFKFPSEYDYSDSENFLENSDLADVRRDKRINARKRRRFVRVNIVILVFLLVIGVGIGFLYHHFSVESYECPFQTAFNNRDFYALAELSPEDFDFNAAILDPLRNTYEPPFVIAVRRGDYQMVRELYRLGANINVRFGIFNYTPLHRSVDNQGTHILEFLLARVENPDPRDDRDWTPLHRAVLANRYDMSEILLAAYADVNAQTADGSTALHLAIRAGRANMVELLLSHGADRWLENNRGETALDSALALENTEIIELLN